MGKDRRRLLNFHRLIVEQEAEIAEMAVCVENERVKYEHTAERVLRAKPSIQPQQLGNRCLPIGKVADFDESGLLIGKQTALGYQSMMVEIQVVIHSLWTNLCRNLARKEFGQRLDFIGVAAALVEINSVRFAHPAFCVIAVRTELRRGGGQGLYADHAAESRLRDEGIKLVSI